MGPPPNGHTSPHISFPPPDALSPPKLHDQFPEKPDRIEQVLPVVSPEWKRSPSSDRVGKHKKRTRIPWPVAWPTIGPALFPDRSGLHSSCPRNGLPRKEPSIHAEPEKYESSQLVYGNGGVHDSFPRIEKSDPPDAAHSPDNHAFPPPAQTPRDPPESSRRCCSASARKA